MYSDAVRVSTQCRVSAPQPDTDLVSRDWLLTLDVHALPASVADAAADDQQDEQDDDAWTGEGSGPTSGGVRKKSASEAARGNRSGTRGQGLTCSRPHENPDADAEHLIREDWRGRRQCAELVQRAG